MHPSQDGEQLVPRPTSRGQMDTTGDQTISSHKHNGNTSSLQSTANLLQDTQNQISTPQDRQQNSHSLHSQQRGEDKSTHEPNIKRNLEICDKQQHQHHSRIHSIEVEHRSGPRIPLNRFQRMETKPKHLQPNNKETGTARHRPICITGNQANTTICKLQTRSQSSSSGCFPDEMDSQVHLCIPTIQNYRESTQQNKPGTCNWDHNYANMDYSNMVPTATPKPDTQSNTATTVTKPTQGPSRKHTSNAGKQQAAAGGLASIEQSLQDQGISPKAAQLMAKSRAPGTNSNYEASWNKFDSWCKQQQHDSIRCPINRIIEYLTNKFYSQKVQYATMNNHRSAISLFHEPVEGYQVGNHPLIKQLLKAMARQRPRQAKSNMVWDVDIVINYYKNTNNDDLTIKQLTQKTLMLIALVGIPRASELYLLDTQTMIIKEDHIIFQITGNVKHTRMGKPNKPIIVHAFPKNTRICPIQTIKDYLAKT